MPTAALRPARRLAPDPRRPPPNPPARAAGAPPSRALPPLLGLAAACGVAPEERGTRELAHSLEVKVGRDSVRFVLHVTNPSGTPVQLRFATPQRYDFVVRARDGAEIWGWAADRGFGEAGGAEVVGPGQSLRYEASWSHRGHEGAFVGIGRLLAENVRLEGRAEFELP